MARRHDREAAGADVKDWLLAVDIDGTLARPIEDGERYWDWRQRVERGKVAPLEVAQAAVARLPRSLATVVITGRMESLRAATARWVALHFPRLSDAPLYLREQGDRQDSWAVKLEHMQAARNGRRIILVDDDPSTKHALFPGDVFVLAPDWPKVTAVYATPGV